MYRNNLTIYTKNELCFFDGNLKKEEKKINIYKKSLFR